MIQSNTLKYFQILVILIFTIFSIYSISLFFNFSHTWVHPEYFDWVGNTIRWSGSDIGLNDLLAGIQFSNAGDFSRPRFINYILNDINVKFRLLLYSMTIPFPNISIGTISLVALAPVLFFFTASRVLKSRYMAWIATAVYVTSIGFLSSGVFLFHQGKPATHVVGLALLALLSVLAYPAPGSTVARVQKFGLQRPTLVSGVLLLNFVGIAFDESYLVLSMCGVLLFYRLFFPMSISSDELRRSALSLGLFTLPFVLFIAFTAFVVPLIAATTGVSNPNYVDFAIGRATHFDSSVFWGMFSKIVFVTPAASFVPTTYLRLDGRVYYAAGVLYVILAYIAFLALSHRRNVQKNEGQLDLVRTDAWIGSGLASVSYLLFMSLLSMFHPHYDVGYYYGATFAIPFSLFLASALNFRSPYLAFVGSTVLVWVTIMQIANFQDTNDMWRTKHNSLIYKGFDRWGRASLFSPELRSITAVAPPTDDTVEERLARMQSLKTQWMDREGVSTTYSQNWPTEDLWFLVELSWSRADPTLVAR